SLAHSSENVVTQPLLIHGTDVAPLDGEELRRGQYGSLYLTNQRVIESDGDVLQVAFLRDIDYAGLVSRSLPLWVLILGIFLCVRGIGLLESEPGRVRLGRRPRDLGLPLAAAWDWSRGGLAAGQEHQPRFSTWPAPTSSAE